MLFRKRHNESEIGRKKNSTGFTLLIIPNHSGITRCMSVPKFVFLSVVVVIFGCIGTVTAITMDYVSLRARMSDYDSLKMENANIRSEATALAQKLEKVQSTLTKVDSFSDQVRAVVQSEPTAKKKPGTSQEEPQSTREQSAIGPLSKEEFALLKAQKENNARAAGVVNYEKLEFKHLFTSLADIDVKGTQQAKELELLLGDLHAYRKQLDATPTISPVKGWVTSMFGYRNSPFLGKERMHWGLDIAAPLGSPIASAGNGTITKVGNADNYGK